MDRSNSSVGLKEPGMRPFLFIWAGQACSLLGSQLVQFAIVWWLTRETGSATVLAFATLAALLPQLLVGPFAGALVDRWKRKTVLIAADALSAAATLLLAGLFALGLASIWGIYALLLVRAAAAAFHWPAMQASITLLVPREHLVRVGGMNQSLAGLAGIFIPPLGALAIETLPMQAVLAIDVATAIPAIGVLVFASIPQPPRAPLPAGGRPSLLADMRAGLHYILAWPALVVLALIGLVVQMLGRASAALIPLMITQRFAGGAPQLGWWQSAYGLGAVAGGLLLSLWGGIRLGGLRYSGWRPRRIATSMLSLTLDGLVCLLIGLAAPRLFPWTVAGMATLGVLEATLFGINGAIGQAVVAPEMQGRVFALILSASNLAAPLGLLVAGPFADAYGVQTWWIISSVIITLTGAAGLLSPALMHIEDGRPPAPAPLEKVSVG